MWTELVRLALAEDGDAGDVTSEAVIPAGASGAAHLVARDALVVSGLVPAAEVFALVDRSVRFEPLVADGDRVEVGAPLASVEGNLRALLRAERPALNFLQRLSGVASWTARHVEVAGGRCRVADTRKTTPGWRALEKAAVRHGGGVNHRFHLGDGVLIKDNHLEAAGGVIEAVAAARARAHHLLKVEVEVDTLEQLEEALASGADAVLLDNMSPSMCAEAVRRVAGRLFVEASGGIDLSTLSDYAATGVDQVALGSLTHGAVGVDIGMDMRGGRP